MKTSRPGRASFRERSEIQALLDPDERQLLNSSVVRHIGI